MIFKANPGQTSYGQDIGILLLDSHAPFIQGDVANAKSYAYPVRFKPVPGLTVERLLSHDLSLMPDIVQKARELEQEGVRAISSDCGFMGFFQKEVQAAVNIPVLLSSLLQIPFIRSTLPQDSRLGIITAHSGSLSAELFSRLQINDLKSLVIAGLQDKPYFYQAAIAETGTLDSDQIRLEVKDLALDMLAQHPDIKSLLLECSMLPPYGAEVQEATKIPVYDFLSMINLVQGALVKQTFADST